MADTALCPQLSDFDTEYSDRVHKAARANLKLAGEPPIHGSLSFSALLLEVLDEQADKGLLDFLTYRSSSH